MSLHTLQGTGQCRNQEYTQCVYLRHVKVCLHVRTNAMPVTGRVPGQSLELHRYNANFNFDRHSDSEGNSVGTCKQTFIRNQLKALNAIA